MIPAIRFSPEEVARHEVDTHTLLLGARAFARSGVLLLENAFSPALVQQLRAAFEDRHAAYLEDRDYPDALKVGDKRTMITVRVEGAFNTPELYANPMTTPLIDLLLGDAAILGSFGAVVSLPGAADQHVHRDHPGLFEDDAIDTLLPSYAITMIVPLVELNDIHGTTRVWKGSHRVALADARAMEYQDPVAAPGSCLLMDYRLLHGGTANRSSHVRPILYIAYHRPWFRDQLNFDAQPAVVMSRADHAHVPTALRRWLSAAVLD